MLLEGKVALVTGAGRGLGWGIARAMGLAGAKVCATDIDPKELARTTADLEADGSVAVTQLLDVVDMAAFQEVVREVVARWGRLDVLIHCAMYMPLIPFEECSHELWWRQFDINLRGFYNGTRAVWELMKAQGGGHLIGIASGSSFRGYKNEVAYCTGKHGLEGFVKALALEFAPYHIALNTMGPGKKIKPTDVTWDELEQMPAERKALFADPVKLGEGFVWLACQPPSRFSGLRFDAGTIMDTIADEGFDFEFAPEKVTRFPDDMMARLEWQANYPG
jgi:NAD(P)-dependent dehydrogenase (short-subunit alcohol dehydrogenase family)